MAKIKFNLNFGGEQIRTLDDLRENFSIEDVLDVYNNDLLAKWLDVHNHKDELEKVKAIQATDARSVLTELIKIFGVSDDPAEIEETLSVLDYLDERKKVHEDMKAHGITDYENMKKKYDELLKENAELQEILETKTPEVKVQEIQKEVPKPAKSYDSLIQEIIYNHQDLNHIYDCLDAITADYPDILKEKYSELFNRFYNEVPHVTYALLGHHATRPFFVLSQDEFNSVHENGFSFKKYHGNPSGRDEWYLSGGLFLNDKERFEKIPSCVNEKLQFVNILLQLARATFTTKKDIHKVIRKEYLFQKTFVRHIYAGRGDGRLNWITVEPDNKRFMLFYGDESNQYNLSVAGTYTHNKLIETNQLSLTFPILSGIDAAVKRSAYHPNDDEIGFCYMEAR